MENGFFDRQNDEFLSNILWYIYKYSVEFYGEENVVPSKYDIGDKNKLIGRRRRIIERLSSKSLNRAEFKNKSAPYKVKFF